jgi:hypothetical protein
MALAGTLIACGGGGSPARPDTVAPPVPAASISATGAGALVVHPSADRRFLVAVETPIRITETGGGTADWNFARMSLFLRGAEIERSEQGADVIRSAGFNRISGNSNAVYRVVFRFNADNFDRVDLTLGFGDIRDGRQFTVAVPFNSFTDVNTSFTPLGIRHSTSPL